MPPRPFTCLPLVVIFALACDSRTPEIDPSELPDVAAAPEHKPPPPPEVYPTDPSNTVPRAKEMWAADNREAAVALLKKSAGDDPVALNELGFMQLKLNDLAGAQLNLEKALLQPRLDDPLKAEILFNLALTTEKRQNYEAALGFIEQAIALAPTDAARETKDRILAANKPECNGWGFSYLGHPKVVALAEQGGDGGKTWSWVDAKEFQPGSAVFSGDLNADGKADLVLNHGECASEADCQHAVYVGCGDDRYALLWADFAKSIAVTETATTFNDRNWLQIAVTFSKRKSGPPAGEHLLSFLDGEYKIAEPHEQPPEVPK